MVSGGAFVGTSGGGAFTSVSAGTPGGALTTLLQEPLAVASLQAQEIKRRADIGARFMAPDGVHAGAKVRSVTKGSQLEQAGLEVLHHSMTSNRQLHKPLSVRRARREE